MSQTSSPFTVSAFYGTPRKKFRSLQTQSSSNLNKSDLNQNINSENHNLCGEFSTNKTKHLIKTPTRPVFSALHKKTSELLDKVNGSIVSDNTNKSSATKKLVLSNSNSTSKINTLDRYAYPSPSSRSSRKLDLNASSKPNNFYADPKKSNGISQSRSSLSKHRSLKFSHSLNGDNDNENSDGQATFDSDDQDENSKKNHSPSIPARHIKLTSSGSTLFRNISKTPTKNLLRSCSTEVSSPSSSSLNSLQNLNNKLNSNLISTVSSKIVCTTTTQSCVNYDDESTQSETETQFQSQAQDQASTSNEIEPTDANAPLPLKNLGNTCYENSIVQCLFSLSSFMRLFKSVFESVTFVEGQQNSIDDKSISKKIDKNDAKFKIAFAFKQLYDTYNKKRIQLKLKNAPPSSPKSENSISSQTEKSTLKNMEDAFKSNCISISCATSGGNSSIMNSTEKSATLTSTLENQNKDGKKTQIYVDNVMITNEDDDNAGMSVLLGSPPASFGSVDLDLDLENSPGTSTVQRVEKNQDEEKKEEKLILKSSGQQQQSESPVPLTADSELDEKLTDLKLAVGERSTQFNSTHQQDASEFFYHVIDTIQEFFQDLNLTHNEPVTSTFEFELDYFVTCIKCGHRSTSDTEKIRTLALAIPEPITPPQSSQTMSLWNPISNDDTDNNDGNREVSLSSLPGSEDKENDDLEIDKPMDFEKETIHKEKEEISVQSALVQYFRDDPIEFKCSQEGCDSQEKTRKCMIKKLPKVLFITLARYSHSGQKNLDDIKAPFELQVPFKENKSPNHSPVIHRGDIDPTDCIDDENSTYQLVAVVCHLGSSLNAGHYTSYVFNQTNKTWYSCDDDAITKADVERVERDSRRSGYCFFYAHKSTMEST